MQESGAKQKEGVEPMKCMQIQHPPAEHLYSLGSAAPSGTTHSAGSAQTSDVGHHSGKATLYWHPHSTADLFKQLERLALAASGDLQCHWQRGREEGRRGRGGRTGDGRHGS